MIASRWSIHKPANVFIIFSFLAEVLCLLKILFVLDPKFGVGWRCWKGLGKLLVP